ncbi:hypothetical protein [Albidovulum sp.]|uniref:hypothetical protein n=1 Tax=Albidovulum sp. TaxID=1872424 RepID=UPI0039B97E83
MPQLVRLYIRNVLTGFGLSAAFVGALLWFNVANLWHLISTSPQGWIAALMLFFFNGVVFAGVQFAIVIMRMDDSGGSGGRGRKVPVATNIPALAGAPARAGAAARR